MSARNHMLTQRKKQDLFEAAWQESEACLKLNTYQSSDKCQ